MNLCRGRSTSPGFDLATRLKTSKTLGVIRRSSSIAAMHTPLPHRSGRIEARIGLRMMPTFPRSPLSFRTVSFPQYGCKAGFPSGAFLSDQRLKPAPGMRRLTFQFASALRASRGHVDYPVLRRVEDSIRHRHGGRLPHRPRGPRSGPGCSVPVRHHLIGPIRPTRGRIPISPHGGLYAMPSLCGSA